MNAPLGCIFQGISRNPQKTKNFRPHPHFKLWGFLRINSQKPQKFYAILNLKKPQNFWNYYPQPRKTSNFEDEVEDPRILRSWLTALTEILPISKLHSNVTIQTLDFKLWCLPISKPVDLGKSYISLKKALCSSKWMKFWNWKDFHHESMWE